MNKSVAPSKEQRETLRPPKITGINHLAVVTNDMQATVRFWCDILGLHLKMAEGADSTSAPDPNKLKRYYFLELGNGDTISFLEYPKKNTQPPDTYSNQMWPEAARGWPGRRARPEPPSKVDHIALNVDTREDVLAFQKRLRDYGIPTTEMFSGTRPPYFNSIYVYDPNGIPLQIGTNNAGPKAGKKLSEEELFTDPDPVPFLREMLSVSKQVKKR